MSFLFLIVAKGLSDLIRKALLYGRFSGYKVGKQQVEVSLLQFVDGTLFFVEASMQNIMFIKAIMRSFEFVLGLKVNFHKSFLGGLELMLILSIGMLIC